MIMLVSIISCCVFYLILGVIWTIYDSGMSSGHIANMAEIKRKIVMEQDAKITQLKRKLFQEHEG